jgi:ornithine cyclodeaminase/alanine dehydrogenase-like protein (mu-crystallin family)
VTPASGADVVVLDRAGGHDVLRTADVIVCATAARSPLFDADLVADTAVVIAVGSHEPDARELPARSAPGPPSWSRTSPPPCEAGDVRLALDDKALRVADMVGMRDLLTGRVRPDPGRPLIFKSVGMSWEDLVVAEAVLSGPQPG